MSDALARAAALPRLLRIRHRLSQKVDQRRKQPLRTQRSPTFCVAVLDLPELATILKLESMVLNLCRCRLLQMRLQ